MCVGTADVPLSAVRRSFVNLDFTSLNQICHITVKLKLYGQPVYWFCWHDNGKKLIRWHQAIKVHFTSARTILIHSAEQTIDCEQR